MPTNKLEKLNQLLSLLKDQTITPSEVEKFLGILVNVIKQANDNFRTLSADNIEQIKSALAYISVEHSQILKQIDDKTNDLQNISNNIKEKLNFAGNLLDEISKIKATPGKDGYTPVKGIDYFDGQPGLAGKNGSPDSGEEIVQKVNDLPTDDDELKIDASHIKNFPKEVGKHIIAHSRNLDWFDETTLVVSNPTQIKFQGSGVQISQDSAGALIVTVAGGASNLTFVDEAMTDSGDHTSFTLSQTPNSGTLLVINENTGQAVPASAYTNTTTTVTFNSSQQIDDGAGNLITPTFRARYSY